MVCILFVIFFICNSVLFVLFDCWIKCWEVMVIIFVYKVGLIVFEIWLIVFEMVELWVWSDFGIWFKVSVIMGLMFKFMLLVDFMKIVFWYNY